MKKSAPVPLKTPPKLGQAFVLDDFIRAVRSGARPRTDVVDNIRSIAMVFAAVKAVRTGRKVPVLDADILRAVRGTCVPERPS